MMPSARFSESLTASLLDFQGLLMKKISFVFGTRPEAIKLCPVIHAMHQHPDFEPHVCVTGQHQEMLLQVLQVFDTRPDVDFRLMSHNQGMGEFASRAIRAVDQYLADYKPDMVLVQGDTSTAFCAALSAFYHRIPIGHVEAGLRTWDKFSPYPEEVNRVLASRLADLHFAPTRSSRDNLLKEGISADSIHVTGNSVIDALHLAVEKLGHGTHSTPGLPTEIMSSDKNLVLITGHRRENFGDGFLNICRAVAALARQFPSTAFVYPVHLNPNVQVPVRRLLGNTENIFLLEPLSYLSFVALMNRSSVILTDSGGVQEEAPSLGKPVLVMRSKTERPEALEAGTVKLVGTDVEKICLSVAELLTDKKIYASMAKSLNPYGDGKAAGRILAACDAFLNMARSSV